MSTKQINLSEVIKAGEGEEKVKKRESGTKNNLAVVDEKPCLMKGEKELVMDKENGPQSAEKRRGGCSAETLFMY